MVHQDDGILFSSRNKRAIEKTLRKLNAYYKVKEAIVKGHMLYDLGIIHCGKGKIVEAVKRSMVAGGSVGRE